MPDMKQARSVVVTGGSSGIGAQLCRLAAHRQWHVWIGYASGLERAERLAAEIGHAGGSATPIFLPLHDMDRLRDGVAVIAEQGPPVQSLVLCGAEAPNVASLLKLSPEQFRRQFESAVIGNYVLLTEIWRRCFRSRSNGHVLAVLSAAQGPPATPHMASYVVAKGAFEALLQTALAELGRAGLRVSVVRPGFVETPMLQAFEPLLLERVRAGNPNGAFLSAGQVAAALLNGLQNPPPAGSFAELPLNSETAVDLERVC